MKKIISSSQELIQHLHSIINLNDGAGKEYATVSECKIDYEILLPKDFKPFKSGVTKDFNIAFDNCDFNKIVRINSTDKRVYFKKCKFYKKVSLRNSEFTNNVKIQNCEFHAEPDFFNATFIKLADFWKTKFLTKLFFYKTDFNGTVVFSATEFHENVLFTYTLFNNAAIFRRTIFSKGVDLSQAIINGKFSFFDFTLNNYEPGNRNYADEEIYQNAIGVSADIPPINKRETFGIIRRTFQSNSDFIHSHKYKKIEIDTYGAILKENIKSRSKFWSSIGNGAIILLNKISSNHGNSWFTAFIFILSFGLFFYYLSFGSTQRFEISLSLDNWQSQHLSYFGINFIKFLNPAHSPDYLGSQNEFGFYIWDYIGRIFVGYGIYQFIQAFRKFR